MNAHSRTDFLSSGKMYQKINAGYQIMIMNDDNMSKRGDYQTSHDYYQISHSDGSHTFQK